MSKASVRWLIRRFSSLRQWRACDSFRRRHSRNAFGKLQVEEAIPATWEERAKLAWEYYTEEPIVKNAVNAWRTFALGHEIAINCNDHEVK